MENLNLLDGGIRDPGAVRKCMAETKRRRLEGKSKRKPRGFGQERRNEILTAAKELFANEGFARVTTRALAEKAGLSQTGLYVYFSTKEDILRAISDQTHDALAAAFDRAVAEANTPSEKLRKLVRVYIDFGLAHPAEYQLTFTVGPDALSPINKDFARPFEQQEPGARSFLRFRDHLSALISDEQLGSLDPMVAAQILWFVGHGAVSLLISRSHFPWADRETLINGVVNLVIKGLSSS
jgi:AcrR family transcriptional regulator